MSFVLKRGLYESLPPALKKVFCQIPFSWMAGRAYRNVVQRGEMMDRASRSQIKAYQEEQLSRVLSFATRYVPAYRQFQGVVERLAPIEALQHFPFADKDIMQENLEHYLPTNFEFMPHHETTTGGTTGNQLKFYRDDDSSLVEIAFMHRLWGRIGYRPSLRKATFRGVSFPNLKPGVYWQNNPIYNEIQFSPFHMSEENLPAYVDAIIRYRPKYLHGYPSAISMLADFVLRNNLSAKLSFIEAILLGSEGVTLLQRQRIEEAFKTRAFSWYGHSERVVLAGECEKSNVYHHFPDYGFLEIVDDEGNSCREEGQEGEIVGTGFYNLCMPLIRYRAGDYATRMESDCACGRQWERFTDVKGRRNLDMLLGKTGAKISLTALNMHGPIFEHVKRYQYYQDRLGKCIIKVMVTDDFSESDLKALKAAYQQKTGAEVDFEVKVVADIPLTKRGKLRLLDSKIDAGDNA